ncbi:DUF5696 domain-containing protein [Congzhengia sp.]|uniref:DUF5696 domain-containing protein n=1 Tax=Congzhengia sp. TaxID=2944168 RepID=UPI003077BB7A
MFGITSDNKRIELPVQIEKTNDYACVIVSKDLDYSYIRQVEADFFGIVADTSDSGYLVLPRGVGNQDYSLFYFNRQKENFESRIAESNMPFFGIKTEQQTVLAIVTGMPYDYTLNISLKNGKYRIYPVFKLDGESPYEDLKIEYFYLTGDDANYSGIARRYRRYKLDKGEIVPLSVRMQTSEALRYAADSVMIRIRCGWKPAPPQVLHQTPENEPPMHVACDFNRVGNLLDELKTQGVDKAEICLVGWNVKGHDGRWPQAFPVCQELGGEETLKQLILKAQKLGYQITCHTNHTDQYEIADCYNPENTRRNRVGKPVINANGWSGGEMFDLCPEIGLKQAEQVLPKVADLGFRGIHYIDVLGTVYPRKCYHPAHFVNSKKAVECAKKMCIRAKELFGGISSEGAYDFLAPYLDYGLYISYSRETGGLCHKPIPFWQLVYHGTVLSNPYTDTVNSSFKDKNIQLKLIEYGGRPTFYFYSAFMDNGNNWMGAVDAKCDNETELAASVSKIKQSYEEYKKLRYLQTEFMEQHEETEENVFVITYSNGAVIKIDYNKGNYELVKEGTKLC